MEDMISRYATLRKQYAFVIKYATLFRHAETLDDILNCEFKSSFWKEAVYCKFPMKPLPGHDLLKTNSSDGDYARQFQNISDPETLSQFVFTHYHYITHCTREQLSIVDLQKWFNAAFWRLRRLIHKECEICLEEVAASAGFSVEHDDDPFGFYTLDYDEFALLCNRCGEHVILKYDEPELLEKIQTLKCADDECGLKNDVLEWTACGEMAWCCDLLHIISSMNLSLVNKANFNGNANLNIPEDGEREIYFAPDPSIDGFAYAFIVYVDEEDEWQSRYLLLHFEVNSWGQSKDITVRGRWPYYYRELHKAIKESLNADIVRNSHAVNRTFNSYLTAYNAMYSQNYTVWTSTRLLCALEGLTDSLGRMVNDPEFIRDCQDVHLHNFLKTHTCPVCQKPYTDTESVCLNCQFPDLNRVFVNKEDAEYWKEHVLLPYKQNYEKKD